jgi:hypothetical protein
MRGPLRDRTGLVYGALRASPESVRCFAQSIEDRGLLGLSAAAFARIVLNAPAGFCCKELGLRGPHTALTCGGGTGLLAVVLAAELIATRADVDVMLGAAVDERAQGEGAESMGEWATAIALTASDEERAGVSVPSYPRVQLSGWGLAGAGNADAAVEAALHMAGADAGTFDRTFDEADYAGDGSAGRWATPSALAFCHAVSSLRGGGTRRVLVTSDSGAGVALAAILKA